MVFIKGKQEQVSISSTSDNVLYHLYEGEVGWSMSNDAKPDGSEPDDGQKGKPTRKQWVSAAYDVAETAAKVIATFTALIAALAFACPWWGKLLNEATASRFGAKGHVFYEVMHDRDKANSNDPSSNPDKPWSITYDGNFYAPYSPARDYNSIKVGDVVQAGRDAFIHEKADKGSAYTYVLNKKDCVIVLGKEGFGDKPQKPQPNYSNGWLYVATAACGLFK